MTSGRVPARPADILVLGAGAAGLAAAAQLSAAGLTVTVLEARTRAGGRILTVRDPTLPLPIELGAEFIHGDPPELRRIVRAAGLSVYETSAEHLVYEAGALRRSDSFEAALGSLLAPLEPDAPDCSFAALLSARAQDASPLDVALARSYVEGFHAAEADRVSARWVTMSEWEGALDNEPGYRILDGYEAVITHLRAALHPTLVRIHFDAAVREVHWRPGGVDVETRSLDGTSATFSAGCAVVALPLGVLKASDEKQAVHFLPEVPGKRDAVDRLEMGTALRLVLRFREAWWEERTQPGFVHVPGAPIPTWWTPAPIRAPVITGWAGGSAALRLAGIGTEALIELATDTLAAAFATRRDRVEALLAAGYWHDWSADPFSLGAYSYVGVGGAGAQAALAAPVEDTLFFAGEATDAEGRHATVHGAIASGYRAASEILAQR